MEKSPPSRLITLASSLKLAPGETVAKSELLSLCQPASHKQTNAHYILLQVKNPKRAPPIPQCKDSLWIRSLMATLNEVSAGLTLNGGDFVLIGSPS